MNAYIRRKVIYNIKEVQININNSVVGFLSLVTISLINHHPYIKFISSISNSI